MRAPPATARPALARSRCAASSSPTPTITAPCSAWSARRGCGSRGWSWTTRELAAIIRDPDGRALSQSLDERRPRRRHARARLPRAAASASSPSSACPRARRARATAAGCSPKRSSSRGATASAESTSTPARSTIRPRSPPTAAPASPPIKRAIERFPDPRLAGHPAEDCAPQVAAAWARRAAGRPAERRSARASPTNDDHERGLHDPGDQRHDQRRDGQRLGRAEQRLGEDAADDLRASAGPRPRR